MIRMRVVEDADEWDALVLGFRNGAPAPGHPDVAKRGANEVVQWA